jgi:hypothetical protein
MGEKGRISISTTTRTEEDLGGAFGTISDCSTSRSSGLKSGVFPDGAGASGAVLLSASTI